RLGQAARIDGDDVEPAPQLLEQARQLGREVGVVGWSEQRRAGAGAAEVEDQRAEAPARRGQLGHVDGGLRPARVGPVYGDDQLAAEQAVAAVFPDEAV